MTWGVAEGRFRAVVRGKEGMVVRCEEGKGDVKDRYVKWKVLAGRLQEAREGNNGEEKMSRVVGRGEAKC